VPAATAAPGSASDATVSARSGVVGSDAAGIVGPSTPGTGAARPAGVEPRIVRTGSTVIDVEPGTVDRAMSRIATAATGFGGYMSDSQTTGTATTADDERESGSVTLRVPTVSFQKLRDMVAGVGTVRSATMTSKDVTGDYVDLVARKTALETSRTTYLTLLGKATTIGEIISVQQQIDGLQVQIEQLEGQRQVLADASDLATLTVEISEVGAAHPRPPAEPSGMSRALHRAWDNFVDGVESIVEALGTVLLFVLVGAVLYAAYRIARLFRPRRPLDAAAPPARPADVPEPADVREPADASQPADAPEPADARAPEPPRAP
jgi:hypothetical protein